MLIALLLLAASLSISTGLAFWAIVMDHRTETKMQGSYLIRRDQPLLRMPARPFLDTYRTGV